MSLAYEELDVIPVKNAALHVDEPVHYAAYLGGSTITYKEVISTSYSNAQASFSANPPSPNVIVDRNVLLKVPVTFTFTGTSAPGARLLQSGYDAPRAFPLHSVMQSLQLSINNNKVTIEASELVHEMMLAEGENSEREHLSMTPCFPDQSQEFAELVNTNRNPLAQFGERSESVPFRGGFPYDSISNPVDGVSATVAATFCEPLLISPLLWGGFTGKGLLHVQNMSIQVNWDSDLARMWSHASGSGSTITNVQVSLGQPSLLFKYITPPATMELPREVAYNYQDTEVYVNELGASQAPGASYTMLSSNIQLNVVPDHLLVYAKERRSDRSYTTTDAWQSIESMEVSFANVSGILSGADKRELYQISRSNGMNQSWSEWSGDKMFVESGGSSVEKHARAGIMVLKLGKDIALNDPSVTVGTPGSYNLQIRCGLKNQNPIRDIYPALYVVPIYAGLMTIKDNQTIQQLAVLSQEDVLDAAEEADNEGALSSAHLEGGAWYNDLAKGFKKALPYIRKGRKVAQTVASAIPTPEAQAAKGVLDVAEAVGLGKKGKKGKKEGGIVIGGQKLSRSDLRKQLSM